MIGVACLLMFTRGVTTAKGSDLFLVLCDAFFVPGGIMAGFGLLVVASNGGAFDMIAYGIMSLFALFYRNPAKRKYHTFYDYRVHKEENKATYSHFLISGLIFVAISLVFLILFYINFEQ